MCLTENFLFRETTVICIDLLFGFYWKISLTNSISQRIFYPPFFFHSTTRRTMKIASFLREEKLLILKAPASSYVQCLYWFICSSTFRIFLFRSVSAITSDSFTRQCDYSIKRTRMSKEGNCPLSLANFSMFACQNLEDNEVSYLISLVRCFAFIMINQTRIGI